MRFDLTTEAGDLPVNEILKTYSELIQIPDFFGRFNYLRLGSQVGRETFGSKRYLNQRFYTSPEWKHIRTQIIARDLGCDLACTDRPIYGRVYIHHINPLTVEQLITSGELAMLPDFLVCTSYDTHQAIHFGDEHLLVHDPVQRAANDQAPWRH